MSGSQLQNAPASAMAGLRAWASHQRLDRRIDFGARLATVSGYRHHIERMWGFYVSIEARLDSGAFGNWLTDYAERHKAPLLERDILALGAEPNAIATLPRCPVPACDGPHAAFGCAYVLEGATLGGLTLLPLVQARLGLTANHGAAFLASYGNAIGDMWRSFGQALERWCSTAQDRRRAAEAASATFLALEWWLCGAPA